MEPASGQPAVLTSHLNGRTGRLDNQRPVWGVSLLSGYMEQERRPADVPAWLASSDGGAKAWTFRTVTAARAGGPAWGGSLLSLRSCCWLRSAHPPRRMPV